MITGNNKLYLTTVKDYEGETDVVVLNDFQSLEKEEILDIKPE